MELFFILLGLTILGIVVTIKSYDYEFLGVIIALIAGFYLIFHTLFCSLASYNYNKFVTKRQAFVETLQYARKNESKFELASITREVSEWNQQLASSKYDNNVFLLKDYVDDRISSLEPIR
jgi:hypothetical protein